MKFFLFLHDFVILTHNTNNKVAFFKGAEGMGTLWYGGIIYTMDKENETVEAVYTNNGFIIETGDYRTLILEFEKEITRYMDLEGKTMFPGLVDSHLHIIGHGEKIVNLDLSAMTSPEEVKRALAERVRSLEPDEWLVGEGWNENQWEDPSVIHKSELDAITTEHPVILSRVCRHALIANSKAMEVAGVSEATEDPQGGLIFRDDKGRTTGYFLDTAQDYIKQVVPNLSKESLKKHVQLAVDDLLKNGLVGGHSEDLFYYGSFNKTFQAFCEAIDGTTRKFRTNLLVHHEVINDMNEEGLGYGDGTPFIELGAMKIFSDGALGGRTAWLTEPYSDDPENKGINIHSRADLEKLIKKARDNEMPVAVHAIGDKAVEEVVEVLRKYPLQNRRRDRIIHAQITNPDLINKLQQVNAVLDIQPTFVASDFPWVIERIGENRLPYAYPWKTFLESGIACAGGSDAPIEDINPLLGIQAAVLRKSSADGKTYGESQKLTLFEAISLYTTGSAYAIGRETERGRILPQYTADFTIFEENLFDLPAEKLHEARVAQTVVEDQIMYERR